MDDWKRLVAGAVLVLVGAAPAGAQALRYGGDPGQVNVYERAQEDHVVQTVEGAEQRVDLQSLWRFSARLTEASSGQVAYELVHDSIAISGRPGGDPTDFTAVYGEPVRVVIGERGEVQEIDVPDSLPASVARLDLETLYRTFFPILPAIEVEPGLTWADTLKMTTNQNGINVSVTRINDYTVRGPTEQAGRAAVQVDYETGLELSGSGSQQGADIALSGTGTGTGTFYFAPDPGIYLGGSETTEVKMDAFVTAAGQSYVIPIVTDRSETITVIE